MAARKRDSDSQGLADVLAPFATVPDFVVYPEDINAKADRSKILKHKALILAVRAQFPNLSFS
jgi:hypothetical protein